MAAISENLAEGVTIIVAPGTTLDGAATAANNFFEEMVILPNNLEGKFIRTTYLY